MTAHRATPSRTRRRSGGPAHAPARGRRGTLWGGLTAVVLLGGAGFAAVGWTSGPEEERGAASNAGTSTGAGTGTGPTPSTRPSTEPSASPSPKRPVIPDSGPGTFTTAPGTSAKVGTGTALRYRVEVEDGLKLSAADVAEQVERILADRRGWTADGRSAFRRVSGGSTDFAVRVATPETVDKICGQYGLDTGGEVNCNVGQDVMVNLKRWELATPVYADDVPAYRALIINHEVGHFLGHGHVTCPGPGKPAPAMMQQIKGMKGCEPNVWPYDEDGTYVTGPAVP
jgi:hypothetical protein